MIPSRTEMRCWLLLGLLILWGGVVALAWDVWQGWPPTPDVPLDVLLHHARTRVDHSRWYILVMVPYGALVCTRAIWWVLRQDTELERLERRTRVGGAAGRDLHDDNSREA